jgi:hypothetical protein
VRRFLEGAKANVTERVIDYKVKAKYGQPVNVIKDVKARFDDFLTHFRPRAFGVCTHRGIINSADAQKLTKAKPTLTSRIQLSGGRRWDQVVINERNWAMSYASKHFPEWIWCAARRVRAPADWTRDGPADLDQDRSHGGANRPSRVVAPRKRQRGRSAGD